VIALTTHVRFADVIVAFAPVRWTPCWRWRLTLHIDPIFVGAHHLSPLRVRHITTPGIVHRSDARRKMSTIRSCSP